MKTQKLLSFTAEKSFVYFGVEYHEGGITGFYHNRSIQFLKSAFQILHCIILAEKRKMTVFHVLGNNFLKTDVPF